MMLIHELLARDPGELRLCLVHKFCNVSIGKPSFFLSFDQVNPETKLSEHAFLSKLYYSLSYIHILIMLYHVFVPPLVRLA